MKWSWLNVFNKNDTKDDPKYAGKQEAGTNLAMPWFLSAAVLVISIWFSKMEGFADALPCFLRSFSYWREGISRWPYDMSCKKQVVVKISYSWAKLIDLPDHFRPSVYPANQTDRMAHRWSSSKDAKWMDSDDDDPPCETQLCKLEHNYYNTTLIIRI